MLEWSNESTSFVILVAGSCVSVSLSLVACVWLRARLTSCLSCCDRTAAVSGVHPRHPAFVPTVTDNVVFEPLPNNIAVQSVTTENKMDRSVLRFTETLGYGWFGWVVTGVTQGGKQAVVKILRDEASPEEVDRFRMEHDSLATVQHENIVSVVMGCFNSFPLLSVLEMCDYMSLKDFLRERRNLQDSSMSLQLCIDVSEGLSALHTKGLAHPDLAARNCVLTRQLTLKLGDYGLGRAKFPQDYWPIRTETVPIRWSAPAQISNTENRTIPLYSRPNVKDNQWTVGILLWEIITWGSQPYGTTPDRDVVSFLEKDIDVRTYFKLSPELSVRVRCILSLAHQCLNTKETMRPRVERVSANLHTISRATELELFQLYRDISAVEESSYFTEVNISGVEDLEEEFHLRNPQTLVIAN